MKVYTFETELGFVEAYDLRQILKEALEVAKKLNKEIYVTCVTEPSYITCVTKPSYRQEWYAILPCGRLITDALNVNKNQG